MKDLIDEKKKLLQDWWKCAVVGRCMTRGEGVLPINGLMGMCCWLGSHSHDWIDYNGVAFSTEFPTELLVLE